MNRSEFLSALDAIEAKLDAARRLATSIATTPGVDLAKTIISSTQPRWYSNDLEANIRRQGNWPSDAEYGVLIRCHDRGNNNHDCSQIKFFSSKEELDTAVLSAQEFYPGSDFSYSMAIYSWDLGPQFDRTIDVN